MEAPVRNGVEIPGSAGVDVPERVDSTGVGTLGTRVVMLNDTSPDSVATGLAEYFARSISIVSYLH